MRSNRFVLFAAIFAGLLSVMVAGSVVAQSTSVLGLEKGSPDLKSAGPLAFGPLRRVIGRRYPVGDRLCH